MTAAELRQRMVDCNDPGDLADWVIELTCGMNAEEPGIENTEAFKELAKDYEDED